MSRPVDIAEVRALLAKATKDWRQGAVEKRHIFTPDGDTLTGGVCGRVLFDVNVNFDGYEDDVALAVAARNALPDLLDEVERLRALRDTPVVDDFWEAVRREKEHQHARWGDEHDQVKEPADWFWLIGYLAGKALSSLVHGDREKALHHTISTAATLAHWHDAIKAPAR